jgi:hypothetical protein|tara:strand:- start:390 stop:632 length:243 start_codon:yes stop_codon:yes gene_type:complete
MVKDNYELQSEIDEQIERNRVLMAQSILSGFQAHDEDGTLWQLIDEMLKQDYCLVTRLEFIINSAVHDAALQEKGGHYAN